MANSLSYLDSLLANFILKTRHKGHYIFLKVYMTDFFFICLIKSSQCTNKYSKKGFSIAIFLSRVLMH